MKTSFNTGFLAPLGALVLAGFILAPVAEAARKDGGGGRASGGAAKAAPAKVANNNTRDVRTNNVRATSVNNVNVNKNVNVNVNNSHGGGWDNGYHPVATAVAVTAAVAVTSAVVGSMVQTVPAGCIPVNYGGFIYQQCGGVWYQPQGTQYVVINPPY